MKNLFLFLLMIGYTSYTFSQSSPFQFVVAKDDSGTHTSVQSAIDDCPDGERVFIFIKNGIYEEQVSIGSRTQSSNKIISLIGESVENVIITSDKIMSSGSTLTWWEVVTFQVYANDFYAENITFENSAGVGGQALAFYNGGDRQTFKNCRLSGHQDTHRSKKGVRCYFKDCLIEGTVDFIYAGGVIFFDDCTLNCVTGTGYIAAPEDCIAQIPRSETAADIFYRIGFFFRNCDITANEGVGKNSYYLGRPWQSRAGAYYLNCRMGDHIRPEGWQIWDGNEKTAAFCEYKSMDMEGNLLDVSNRVDWSYQLVEEDVNRFFNPEFIYDYVKSYNSNIDYDPVLLTKEPLQPNELQLNGNTLIWDAVEEVAGYLLYKNNELLVATTETSYVDNSLIEGEYSIMTMSEIGCLSKPLKVGEKGNTAISHSDKNNYTIVVNERNITWEGVAKATLYNLCGKKVISKEGNNIEIPTSLPGGLYVLQLTDYKNNQINKKITIK